MELIEIDKQNCNKDGICVAVCPSRIIVMGEDGYPAAVPKARKGCIRCGHCVAACPTGCLDHWTMTAEDCPPVRSDWHLPSEHTEHFLRSRRSIRTYKSKSVDKALLQRLIETARYAPSGRNAQDASWLVLEESTALRKNAALVADWMRWTVENDPETARLMYLEKILVSWEKGYDMIFREAPALIVAHAERDNPRAQTTCTIAMTYMELAAMGLGLGCCWAGYFMKAAVEYPPLMEALPLPAGHQCFGAMMVGYPKFKYHRLPLRDEPKITWR